MRKVIDISKWNWSDSMDWKQIKESVDGIIIRIGLRGYRNGTIQLDERFNYYMERCIEFKIPFGVYWFAQEITKNEARESAKFIVKNLKNNKLDYPIYYDVEYSGDVEKMGRADRISKHNRTQCVIAFCEEIRKAGYTSGVYSSEYLFTKLLSFDNIQKYSIWCAKYGYDTGTPGTRPSIKYDMWQYTSKGKINGIKTKVDLNIDLTAKQISDCQKSIDDIVLEVIHGKWGNGNDRKQRLTSAGYDYAIIQRLVNQKLKL